MVYRVVMLLACCAMVLALPAAVCSAAGGPEVPPDPVMGEFAGTLTPPDGQAVKAEVKLIADQESKYRVVLLSPAGDAKARRIELGGLGKDGVVSISDKDWSGKITKEALSLESAKVGKAEMQRVERKSPALGEKPPAGAVVLLPFEEGKPTNLDNWANKKWICEPDGSILVKQGDNKSLRDFGSYKLHVEFRVPFMPGARGQGRGNSGVYQHGRYEIQVLDSFGLTMNAGECGAIYGKKAPDVNASLPPGQWQTYDIEFRAPEFDAADNQTKGAVITVVYNGVKIQDAVEVKGVTGGAWGKPAKTGPIRLQDHGNPMRFRNIWIVEK
ncbi:MAG: DUF1080 domain-containing protein [Thermoguttaceae bacterium]|jgi:hypothetical protein